MATTYSHPSIGTKAIEVLPSEITNDMSGMTFYIDATVGAQTITLPRTPRVGFNFKVVVVATSAATIKFNSGADALGFSINSVQAGAASRLENDFINVVSGGVGDFVEVFAWDSTEGYVGSAVSVASGKFTATAS